MAKNAPPAAAKVAQQPAAPAELFRNSAIPYIAIALAVAGIVLGFILTRNFFQHNIMGEASGCAINAYVDCDRVSQSTFAAIGPVPISAFGLGMHGAVLMALAVAHFRAAPASAKDWSAAPRPWRWPPRRCRWCWRRSRSSSSRRYACTARRCRS